MKTLLKIYVHMRQFLNNLQKYTAKTIYQVNKKNTYRKSKKTAIKPLSVTQRSRNTDLQSIQSGPLKFGQNKFKYFLVTKNNLVHIL